MKLRRTALAIVSATALALSLAPAIANAQDATGSTEDFAAISSTLDSSDDSSTEEDVPGGEDGGEDGEDGDDDGGMPPVGSIPGSSEESLAIIRLVMAVAQLGFAITGGAATIARIVLSVHPNGQQILRDFLWSIGINPDA